MHKTRYIMMQIRIFKVLQKFLVLVTCTLPP